MKKKRKFRGFLDFLARLIWWKVSLLLYLPFQARKAKDALLTKVRVLKLFMGFLEEWRNILNFICLRRIILSRLRVMTLKKFPMKRKMEVELNREWRRKEMMGMRRRRRKRKEMR